MMSDELAQSEAFMREIHDMYPAGQPDAFMAEFDRLRLVEQAATTLVEQVWDEETQTFCCVNHLRSGLDTLAAAVHGETPAPVTPPSRRPGWVYEDFEYGGDTP